jgi:hypothetical protein
MHLTPAPFSRTDVIKEGWIDEKSFTWKEKCLLEVEGDIYVNK